MMKYYTLILIIILSGLSVLAQENDPKVNLNPDFRFVDGVYLNFDQVKNNGPIKSTSIVFDKEVDSPSFYDDLLKQNELVYFNDIGERSVISIREVWGYSQNGVLFIQIKGSFSRITFVGSICHFVAAITVQNSNYNPYSHGYGFSQYAYNPYMYNPNSRNSTSVEMKQFLLDFSNGGILAYDVKSVESILMRDLELHDEYTSLRNKKKKQLKFLYIRKFNDKHKTKMKSYSNDNVIESIREPGL